MKDKREIQGGADTRRHGIVLAVSLLTLLCITLFAQPARASQTSTYVFLAGQSTITQTGGIAGIHRTYTITGTFQLTLDFETRTASFNHVDANAVDDSPFQHTLDLNEVFNMTELSGVWIGETTIRFNGIAHDGSSVLITLNYADDPITLKGETTPPPNSADFFLFALDGVAQRKYSGGTGEPNDPYQIATAADLIVLGETPEDYDKHFILTADIDLDPNLPGRKVFDKAVIAPQGTSFTGVFDGNSHTISHLTIKGKDHVGLFGQLSGDVKNVGVVDVNTTGSRDYVGGLVGENYYGNVTRCYSTGVVRGTGTGVGGLVGQNNGPVTQCRSTGAVNGHETVGGLLGFNGGDVTDCHSTGEVSGTGSWVGGLVGVNSSAVTDCYSTGVVSSTGSGVGGLVGFNWQGPVTRCRSSGAVSGHHSVGGLVGFNEDAVTACYSTGVVSGTGPGVGGLVGDNGRTVTDCYSTGAVSSPSHNIGGLMGYNEGIATHCYSTGTVTGGTHSVGGLVGFDVSTVIASFWNTQTSGQAWSDNGTGKTTAQMQCAATYLDAGWDFVSETKNGTEDIWWILEGKDYPRLWWQLPADDFGDGKAEPLWMLYEPQPERVRLKEVNGRLEVEAIAQSENVDAIYVADGWRLDATKEFAIQVDFHFSKQGGGDGRVTLGVVPSLDPSAMQWAELEAGCFESGPFYLYEVRDGSWVQEVVTEWSSDGGTLYMSYDPNADELYLSYTGYGKANNWRTVKGLLKGRWGSVPVSVILSGGSESLGLTGAEAWMDNFAVSSGVLALN